MKSRTTPGMLDRAEELRLVEAMRNGDPEAADRLVCAHAPLVRGLAKRYVVLGVGRDDLEQEGTLGLLDAARRFDPEHGNRFATYARWWVRYRMQTHVRSLGRIVPLPKSRAMRKARTRLTRARRALEQQLGGPVSDAALAEAIGVREETVREARSGLSGRDVPVVEERSREGVVPIAADDPEEGAAQRERQALAAQLIESALDVLDERERLIVKKRRLDDDQPSLREIGEGLGISGERVRQLEKRALRKLRRALERTHRDAALECVGYAA